MSPECSNPNPEFLKPGLNPFFAAMARTKEGPVSLTPVQRLGVELRKLEKVAESGDPRAWQEQLPIVADLLQSFSSDPMRCLEIQVQIKQHELTLFLKASKRALVQAQAEEKSAREAELSENGAAREHWSKAQKWKRLGEHFQEQLNAQLQAA